MVRWFGGYVQLYVWIRWWGGGGGGGGGEMLTP